MLHLILKSHWFYVISYFTLHLFLKFHWPYTRRDRQTLHVIESPSLRFGQLYNMCGWIDIMYIFSFKEIEKTGQKKIINFNWSRRV